MWRETRIGLEAAALRRSPVFRGLGLPAWRSPPGPPDPRLHGRRRVARDDGAVAAAGRLLHAPHRHPRQPRLLGGGLQAPRGAARAHGRAPRRARRDHRPEPRRRVRPRARRPPAGARLGDRHARLADPARCSRSIRSCSRRSASSARSAPPTCPGCSASSCLRGKCCQDFRDGDRAARSRRTSATSRSTRAATASCSWRSCLDPEADEHVEISASHCGMGVNAQAFLAVANALARFRARRPAARGGHRRSAPEPSRGAASRSPCPSRRRGRRRWGRGRPRGGPGRARAGRGRSRGRSAVPGRDDRATGRAG